MIHQELNLIRTSRWLTTFYRTRTQKGFGVLDKRGEVNRQTKALLESLNLDIDPNTTVSRLSVAEQQMVEIARRFPEFGYPDYGRADGNGYINV